MRLIAKWVLFAGALFALPQVVPGIGVPSFATALIVAFFLGLVNVVVKPIIMLILLPINIITLGLFTFVINALLFWGVASFVKDFTVLGFMPAFWGALAMSVVGVIVHMLLKDPEDN